MRAWFLATLALAMALSGCAPQATGNLPAGVRPDLDRQWLSPAGGLNWPPNEGFSAAPTAEVLPPGTLIDRFGSDGGSFFSPAGAGYSKRALPYVCQQQAYSVFRVAAPLPVWVGHAAPWFDQQGGATQFETDASAARMIRDQAIVPITRDAPGAGGAERPCD